MIDLRAVGGHVAGLAGVAVRVFVTTLLIITLFGVALAATSFAWVQERSPWLAALLAMLALGEAVAVGLVLGFKRALLHGLVAGVRTLGLGQTTVRLLFDRLAGTVAARELGRMPLWLAEEKLTETMTDLTRSQTGGGYFRKKVQSTLLRAVQKYTLARFRAEGSGGVDLLKVRADLEKSADDLLIARLRSGVNGWMVLLALALPAVVAAQTYLALRLIAPVE